MPHSRAYATAGLAESLYNYPTLSDIYRHAILTAVSETRKYLWSGNLDKDSAEG